MFDHEPKHATSYDSLVAAIARGDSLATAELFHRFEKGLRWYVGRRVSPTDVDDVVQNVFLIAIEGLRAGDIRDPKRLAGYLHGIAHFEVCAKAHEYHAQRRRFVSAQDDLTTFEIDPETRAVQNERRAFADEILGALSSNYREVLWRFYIDEQSPARICREMNLTPTQFRLLKNRAKARFVKLGRCRNAGTLRKLTSMRLRGVHVNGAARMSVSV